MEIRNYTVEDLTRILRAGSIQDTGPQSGGPNPAKRPTATGWEYLQYVRAFNGGAWPAVNEAFLGVGPGSSNSPDIAPYYFGKWMLQIMASTAGAGLAGDTIELFASLNDGAAVLAYTNVYRRDYYIGGAIPIGTTIIDLQMQQDMLFQRLSADFNLTSPGGNLRANFAFDGIKIFWR